MSSNGKWYYIGNELEIVDLSPYLGMVFSYKSIFSLQSEVKRFININPVVYCDLFEKIVLSVLYGNMDILFR